MDKNSHLDDVSLFFIHPSSGLKADTGSCGRTRVVGNMTSFMKRSRRQNPVKSLFLFTVMTYAMARDQVKDGRTVLENPGEMFVSLYLFALCSSVVRRIGKACHRFHYTRFSQYCVKVIFRNVCVI